MLKKKLRLTSIEKWITSIIIFFIIIGLSKNISVEKDVFITFYELGLTQLNSIFSVLFTMSFILLLFSAAHENPIELSSSKAALIYLKQAAKSALLLVVIVLTASLTYSVITRGFEAALVNEWSYNSAYSIIGKSPIVCLGITVVLFWLRCVFLFNLISLINTLAQKPYWGFWAVLIICYIDFRFYNQMRIQQPLNILPIEHTRILYTMAFGLPEKVARGSYLISILYWIILISIIYEVVEFVSKKRGKQHEKNVHARNKTSI